MAASSFLMLALQEKVVDVAQSHLENFVMFAVVVAIAAVSRDVVAS